MTDPGTTNAAEPESGSDVERHANNLELFLDLVFVFAVTQIAAFIADDLTAANIGKGTVIAALVWWQWSQFTWAGSASDLQARTATRVLILCTIPATLTMAAAIPGAFTTSGAWFGVAYLLVQLLVLGMQGADALSTPALRASFLRYASAAAVAPVIVAIGGFVDGEVRIAFWVAAIVIDLIGALLGAAGEWTINPVHFAERHALFVIISLGEALVAIGSTAAHRGLDGETFVGLAVAAALACLLWWTYFGFIPAVAEHKLRISVGPERGRVARDLFTIGHFPIVAGLIGYAIAAKHVVDAPYATPSTIDRVLLCSGIVLIIAGYLNMQWNVVRRLAPERLVAVTTIVVLGIVGSSLHGVALLAATGTVIALMQGRSHFRYARDPFVPSSD